MYGNYNVQPINVHQMFHTAGTAVIKYSRKLCKDLRMTVIRLLY